VIIPNTAIRLSNVQFAFVCRDTSTDETAASGIHTAFDEDSEDADDDLDI